ncbi:MAG: hypothetical protein IJA71_02330, partial [Clostridia bacterium]|nr:hypothetical protein [Clostridia bacterium]
PVPPFRFFLFYLTANQRKMQEKAFEKNQPLFSKERGRRRYLSVGCLSSTIPKTPKRSFR